MVPIEFLVQSFDQGDPQREIGHRRKTGAGQTQRIRLLDQRAIIGPVGRLCNRMHPYFPHQRRLGIFPEHGSGPTAHKTRIGIGVGIDSVACNARPLHPPPIVLDHVAFQIRIGLVQIRHGMIKPPFAHHFTVFRLGIGVQLGRRPVIGSGKSRPSMNPTAVHGLGQQRMGNPPMVMHHIHDDLDALGGASPDQVSVLQIVTKASIHSVQIGGRVSMV